MEQKTNMICFQKEKIPITKYTIFGERHSGTNLIQNLFTKYINTDLTWEHGWKHWIGFSDQNKLYEAKDTLFVCIVRNPYDWLAGFFKSPQHTPVKNNKNWNSFLLNEWYSIDNLLMTEILNDRNFLTKKRYQNIFELRKYKINYLRHKLPYLINNYVLFSYEELLKNHQNLLNNIIDYFQIKTKFIDNNFYVHQKKTYHIDSKVLNIINANIDWNIERTVGYFKKAC